LIWKRNCQNSYVPLVALTSHRPFQLLAVFYNEENAVYIICKNDRIRLFSVFINRFINKIKSCFNKKSKLCNNLR
jgi:hypothetical protein